MTGDYTEKVPKKYRERLSHINHAGDMITGQNRNIYYLFASEGWTFKSSGTNEEYATSWKEALDYIRDMEPEDREEVEDMVQKKKNFKATNPAEAFITKPQEEAVEEPVKEESPATSLKADTSKKPPQGYKYNPLYVETKSKRVQLLLQPSTQEGLKELAKEKGISFNELANEIFKDYLERNGK